VPADHSKVYDIDNSIGIEVAIAPSRIVLALPVGSYYSEVHDIDDGSQVPPRRTNQGEQVQEVPSEDPAQREYETIESIPRVAALEDEWNQFATRVRGR
jgi:hypothetical protein